MTRYALADYTAAERRAVARMIAERAAAVTAADLGGTARAEIEADCFAARREAARERAAIRHAVVTATDLGAAF